MKEISVAQKILFKLRKLLGDIFFFLSEFASIPLKHDISLMSVESSYALQKNSKCITAAALFIL
jgi:hypothetical protein